jgi:Tfp pilus assembly protein PilX
MIKHVKNSSSRGFTLLIAVIFTSVVLAVALALLDVSYKQITLASSARQSQYAFYAADSGVECALFQDSEDTFDYTSEPVSGSFMCEGQTVDFRAPAASGGSRSTTFSIPCAGGGTSADITVQKLATGNTNLYSNGYNNCSASDPQRVQRGEEAHY